MSFDDAASCGFDLTLISPLVTFFLFFEVREVNFAFL